MRAYLDSIRRVAQLDVKVLLPGHGPPVPAKALQQLLQHRQQREGRVLAVVQDGTTELSAIARRAYDDVAELPLALMRRQTLAHLIHLEQQNRLRRGATAGESWSVVDAAPVGTTAERIEAILRERFEPVRFELNDDSARHVGHRGASSGGGHYEVLICSAEFAGRSLLEQHRMVYEALSDLLGGEIHALALKTSAP